MKAYQLIKAIEEGKVLNYYQDKSDPEKVCVLEPYRDASNQLWFHFYGWGSAYWTTDRAFNIIIREPQNFTIADETVV